MFAFKGAIDAWVLRNNVFDCETSTKFWVLNCEICYIRSCSLDFFCCFCAKKCNNVLTIGKTGDIIILLSKDSMK